MSERPSIAAVQEIVARHFNVRVTDLRSARRDRISVHARHAAMYLCREHTLFSLPVIGRHFGRRDYTTVMYAIRRVEMRRSHDPEVAEALSQLSEEIAAANAGTAAPPGEAERARALEVLTPLLNRRDALLAELKLVNAQIDELGRKAWGAAPQQGVADNSLESGQ